MDRNTWYYISVLKLLVLRIVTWRKNCLSRIIVNSWNLNTVSKQMITFIALGIWTIVFMLTTWTASLQKSKIPPPTPNTKECPVYNTKLSDGGFPIMLEFWGMWSTPSLLLLPGPHWPGVVVPHRILSMGQIELNRVLMVNWTALYRTVLTFKLSTYAKLNWINCLKWYFCWMLNWIVWSRTVLTFNSV